MIVLLWQYMLNKGWFMNIQQLLKEQAYDLLIKASDELKNIIEELSFVSNTDEELRNTKIIVKLNKILKILEGKDENKWFKTIRR